MRVSAGPAALRRHAAVVPEDLAEFAMERIHRALALRGEQALGQIAAHALFGLLGPRDASRRRLSGFVLAR